MWNYAGFFQIKVSVSLCWFVFCFFFSTSWLQKVNNSCPESLTSFWITPITWTHRLMYTQHAALQDAHHQFEAFICCAFIFFKICSKPGWSCVSLGHCQLNTVDGKAVSDTCVHLLISASASPSPPHLSPTLFPAVGHSRVDVYESQEAQFAHSRAVQHPSREPEDADVAPQPPFGCSVVLVQWGKMSCGLALLRAVWVMSCSVMDFI